MRKICVIIAARPHYARLKSVLKAIQAHPSLELQLVVGASALLDRYGCASVLETDGFTADEKVYTVIEGDTPQTMAASTGLFMVQLAHIFARLKPDFVLCHADRYEQLAVATAAAYMNIPLAHTQGGEVTGSIDERVRHAITKLADVHFVASERSWDNVVRMGENPCMVFNVGCPSLDLLAGLDLNPQPLLSGVGPKLDLSKPYLVVLQHPVTTEYGLGLRQVKETLEVVKHLKMPTAWLWPNVDSGTDDISEGLRRFREAENPDHVRFIKNLPPEDYARLIANCTCLLGNTSSGVREGAWLGVPYVCIGSRQGGREHGENVRFVDYEWPEILKVVEEQIAHGKYEPDHRFGDGHAGERIAEVLATIEPKEKKLTYVEEEAKDLRCPCCGKLLAKTKPKAVEIKCPRCKSLTEHTY